MIKVGDLVWFLEDIIYPNREVVGIVLEEERGYPVLHYRYRVKWSHPDWRTDWWHEYQLRKVDV